MALVSMRADELANRMGLGGGSGGRGGGGGFGKVIFLMIVTLAIAMAVVWWWPLGHLSLWWKIPLSLVAAFVTLVVGVMNCD